MKDTIEKIFKKIKGELKDLVLDENEAKNISRIKDSCEDVEEFLDDLKDEIEVVEDDLEQATDNLKYKEQSTENYIYELLAVCKDMFESNNFSATNVDIINKIAMETGNDSKLLWDHNRK